MGPTRHNHPRRAPRPAPRCTLQLSKSNEFYPASEDGGQDRILLISGTVNQLLTALHLVLTKLKSEPGALRAVQVRARPGAGSGWAGKALPWSCTPAGGVLIGWRWGNGGVAEVVAADVALRRGHLARCQPNPGAAPASWAAPGWHTTPRSCCRQPAPLRQASALVTLLQAKDNEELLQLRMLVHARLCGTLIGKGGATIRSFNEDSKATFNISPPPTMPGAGARGGAAGLGARAGRPGLYVGEWVCARRAWALGGYCCSFEQAPTCGLGLRSAVPGPMPYGTPAAAERWSWFLLPGGRRKTPRPPPSPRLALPLQACRSGW